MEKELLDVSFLDNCRISIVNGIDPRGESYLPRTIIELSGDISPAMPHLSRVIENCGYHPGVKTIAFRIWNMPVVILVDRITVNHMVDLEMAYKFLDWLKEKIKSAA
jgi:hypothetical protein